MYKQERAMPILQVEIVLRAGEVLPDRLAADIADRAAQVFGAAPGRTWVRLHALPRDQYAEDGGGPSRGVYPVFAGVLHRQRPAGDDLRQEVGRLTTVIAEACGRPPENVHLFYEPDALERVSFGGKLVE
jgi:phenylpyruvate tautomerase PptA (4-oxalocrotonate tautomerase family)